MTNAKIINTTGSDSDLILIKHLLKYDRKLGYEIIERFLFIILSIAIMSFYQQLVAYIRNKQIHYFVAISYVSGKNN